MIEILRLAPFYVIPMLVILTVLVTFHELGHVWAAKAFGVTVDRFSVGFGRAIASFKDKSGVEWRVGWIPLGGYVRFGGDSNDASLPDSDDLEQLRKQIVETYGPEAVHRYYHFKPIWQRAVIAAAGPIANFVLAIIILTVMFLAFKLEYTRPVIGEVIPGRPAAEAGILPGDLILRADGHKIRDFRDFQIFVSLRAGQPITFDIDRGGTPVTLQATPRRVVEKERLTGAIRRFGQLGVSSSRDAVYGQRLPVHLALVESVRTVVDRIGTTFTYIGRIFRGHENGDQFSSVIGIANVSGAVTRDVVDNSPSAGVMFRNGVLMFFQLAASLSIGLGFVNLLPIPILDGGHLMFYAYEAVARKPVAAPIQAASFRVGLALVLGLMLFATWNDLQSLQAFKFLGGLFS